MGRVRFQVHFCHAQHGDLAAESVLAAVAFAFLFLKHDHLLVFGLLLTDRLDLSACQSITEYIAICAYTDIFGKHAEQRHVHLHCRNKGPPYIAMMFVCQQEHFIEINFVAYVDTFQLLCDEYISLCDLKET